MMHISGPLLWQITRTSYGPKHDFAIQVSSKYIEMVTETPWDTERIQSAKKGMSFYLKQIYPDVPENKYTERFNCNSLLFERKYGLTQINHPSGGGVWLALDEKDVNGGMFYSHNCDHRYQRDFLEDVFFHWGYLLDVL